MHKRSVALLAQYASRHCGTELQFAHGVLETLRSGCQFGVPDLRRRTAALLGDLAQEMHLTRLHGRRPKPTTRPLAWAGKVFLEVRPEQREGRSVFVALPLGYPRSIIFPGNAPGIEPQPRALDNNQLGELVFLAHAWSWAYEEGYVEEPPIRIQQWAGFHDRLDKLILSSGAWTPPKLARVYEDLSMDRSSWLTVSGEAHRADPRFAEVIAPDEGADIVAEVGASDQVRFRQEDNTGVLLLGKSTRDEAFAGDRITGLYLHPEKAVLLKGGPVKFFSGDPKGVRRGGAIVVPNPVDDLYWVGKDGGTGLKAQYLRPEDQVLKGTWDDGMPKVGARPGMKRDFEDAVRGLIESGAYLAGLEFQSEVEDTPWPKRRYWRQSAPGTFWSRRMPETRRPRDNNGYLWMRCPGTHKSSDPVLLSGNGVEERPFKVLPHGDRCVACGWTFNQVRLWTVVQTSWVGLGDARARWVAIPATGPYVGLLAQQVLRETNGEVPAYPEGGACWPLVRVPDLLPPKWRAGKQLWDTELRPSSLGKPTFSRECRTHYDSMGYGHVVHVPTGLEWVVHVGTHASREEARRWSCPRPYGVSVPDASIALYNMMLMKSMMVDRVELAMSSFDGGLAASL